MRKNIQNKIMLSVLALGAACCALPGTALAGYDENTGNYNVTYDGEVINGDIYNYLDVYGNGHSFTINGINVTNHVYGVGSDRDEGNANGGNVTINDTTVGRNVFGGQAIHGTANKNNVTITNSIISGSIYGGNTWETPGTVTENTVIINDGKVAGDVNGGWAMYGNSILNNVTINGTEVTGKVYGGYSGEGIAKKNTATIIGGIIKDEVCGGISNDNYADNNTVNISGGTVNAKIYGGYSVMVSANNNIVNISGGTINNNVYGGWGSGYVNTNTANNNQIIISGTADIKNANLYGYDFHNKDNATGTGNTLTIDGWSGSTKSAQNFSDINFKNVNWNNGGTVLKITAGGTDDLKDTNINLNSIAGGSKIAVGDTMTFISSNADLTGVNYKTDNSFTAGVALEGEGTASVDSEGNVKFTVNGLKTSGQTELVAQTRAASAAFVNQGTDLIADSLDVLSRDSNYGIKTFAAVHGNKSKYDVNSDIKINGWSTIVGVGNTAEFTDGDNFSWGVFYENGSGNYRTYNSFNNEFFRGDGSLVYNGGGIAARYENNNGVYTEGSLRAGMLKNDMDNALRDASGNNYGYESESAYYGAHIGVGKIISLSESSDLDVYGKFFHTYVEGDSFNVAGDKFEFDSINSDRLRVGARVTTNKENKFSTYYGLAYEYEFNGDADMKAQGINAPTQSLQGSSYMAELGLNYQPTPDSPWSFDLNLRGYTGERQGGSFNVQATYTF